MLIGWLFHSTEMTSVRGGDDLTAFHKKSVESYFTESEKNLQFVSSPTTSAVSQVF